MLKKGISIREFIKKFDNAPFDDQELWGCASEINDHELGNAAKNCLKAKNKFDTLLDEVGFERG